MNFLKFLKGRMMNDWLEILKYTIPSLVVLITAFFILKMFMDNEQRKMLFELKKSNMKSVTPVRLQAYERAILFLERINMENLVKRVNKPDMKPEQLQMALISAIRSEYEHNLSQQIYMSQDAWNSVKEAKEETVKLVHMAKAATAGKGKAMDMIANIFKLAEEQKPQPSQRAISVLKKEVKQLF